MHYVLDESGEPVQEPDLSAWARWFEGAERHVAQDLVGEVRVSTVFLGTDHRWRGTGPPVLWESMVFGGPLDGEQERYPSKKDAARGHAALVARVREAQGPG
jgi:hypothetical protein